MTATQRRRFLRERAAEAAEEHAREEAAARYARALEVEEDDYPFFPEAPEYQLYDRYEFVEVYHPDFYPVPCFVVYHVIHH